MAKQSYVLGRKIIRAAEANMKAEGFFIPSKVKTDCHAMLNGKVTANKLVEQYVSQYKK